MVKSVIRDTIAERRCQAVRGQAWKRGASERRRGRLSGRGAVGRCTGLVPHEKVKSVIRDTIAGRVAGYVGVALSVDARALYPTKG